MEANKQAIDNVSTELGPFWLLRLYVTEKLKKNSFSCGGAFWFDLKFKNGGAF